MDKIYVRVSLLVLGFFNLLRSIFLFLWFPLKSTAVVICVAAERRLQKEKKVCTFLLDFLMEPNETNVGLVYLVF